MYIENCEITCVPNFENILELLQMNMEDRQSDLVKEELFRKYTLP